MDASSVSMPLSRALRSRMRLRFTALALNTSIFEWGSEDNVSRLNPNVRGERGPKLTSNARVGAAASLCA